MIDGFQAERLCNKNKQNESLRVVTGFGCLIFQANVSANFWLTDFGTQNKK